MSKAYWPIILCVVQPHPHGETSGAVKRSVSSVTFDSILPVPQHSRAQSKPGRKRTKPPSYELTSDETMNFVHSRKLTVRPTEKAKKAKKTAKPRKENQKVTKSVASGTSGHADKTPCKWCHVQYGYSKDKLLHETWIACTVCGNWYHLSCAELDGVLEDDGKLFCSACLE